MMYIETVDYFLFFQSPERYTEEEKNQFFSEIEFMKQIGSHRNVLSMLGYWVKSEPVMLILEYVPHGDLLQWLRNKRQRVRNAHLWLLALSDSKFIFTTKCK